MATVRGQADAERAVAARGDGTASLEGCREDTSLTSHAAFDYLADRYGLEQLAITGLSPEAEPDARTLQEIARARPLSAVVGSRPSRQARQTSTASSSSPRGRNHLRSRP